MIPSQRRDLAWGDCRSRSPLSNPSKICKNHRKGIGEESFFKVNNGGERGSQEPRRKASAHEEEEEPLLKGSQICPLWAFATPGRNFRWEAGSSGGTQPTDENCGARN